MKATILLLATFCLLCSGSASTADEEEAEARAEWRRVFDGVAADYELARQPENQELMLIERPTYLWARSGPFGGTYGAVYVWTLRGNAEAVACFWRYPRSEENVAVVHELHSLSPALLSSTGKVSDSWKPKAGVKRHLLADAPSPAATANGRMQQMRTLSRDFAAKSVSVRGERTELRLLPQPLYRYESTNPEVVDGALFAFVCSIGTDPEAFLLLEAIETSNGPRWHHALARFSHMDLFATFKDKEIWQALRDEQNTLSHNADYTYWVFHTPFEKAPRKPASENRATEIKK